MKKRKLLLIIITAFSINNASNAFASTCEISANFDKSIMGLIKNQTTEIVTTGASIGAALKTLIVTINAETSTIMESFQKYSAQRAAYDDAINQMQVVQNRQRAATTNQINNRTPDLGDVACGKATNAKNWSKTNSNTRKLAETHRNGFMESINKQKNLLDFSNKQLDKHTLWFSNIEHEIDPTKPNNPFTDADINSSSLFGVSTFRNKEGIKNITSSEDTPNTMIAAQQFARKLVGKAAPKVASGIAFYSLQSKAEKVKNLSLNSKKNLVFSIFADMIAERSMLKGSNTGAWLNTYYSKLDNDIGTGYSKSLAQTVADDISEYEYKDHMYSKMYMNPDWALSLTAPKKSLKIEQLEVTNKNMSLEWDILLSLEKLATVDGVNLATTLENSSE
ncbi:MAG: hypothetical protein OIF36_04945 [Alphaproteobacteria bacterium]|nr:hypothetical protein [Alphaproteobacteria bacterium]